MAKRAMESLIKTGKVTRGYLGVTIGPVTQELAQQFKVPDTSGAFVQDVAKGGPADKAGLKPGDLIRKFDGRAINDSSDLLAMVASVDPGSEVTLEILRNGEPLTLKAKLDERAANLGFKAGARKAPSEGTLRGISVQELTPGVRKQRGARGPRFCRAQRDRSPRRRSGPPRGRRGRGRDVRCRVDERFEV